MHHNATEATRSELDAYLARQILLHPTSAEACTELGAEDSTGNPDTNPTGGILLGVVLGLTAWALIAMALRTVYMP